MLVVSLGARTRCTPATTTILCAVPNVWVGAPSLPKLLPRLQSEAIGQPVSTAMTMSFSPACKAGPSVYNSRVISTRMVPSHAGDGNTP